MHAMPISAREDADGLDFPDRDFLASINFRLARDSGGSSERKLECGSLCSVNRKTRRLEFEFAREC
jgi:hypothetical protein